ncbi:MAG: hypothetical protein M3069_21855 [Chloroflexota bacterium]|nr:hypothetical protein [Chloroflexota bacterium]
MGLDTYSLRWQGWDAFTLLEYAAGLGLDNVQFSERNALATLDQAEPLDQLRVAEGRAAPPAGASGQPPGDQRRRHFEESFAYAHDVLGLGDVSRDSPYTAPPRAGHLPVA